MARKPTTPPRDLSQLSDDELEKLAEQELDAELDDYLEQFETEMRKGEKPGRSKPKE